MPHDFTNEINAAFAAYRPQLESALALPPPCFENGPYYPPQVQIGDEVECARFGLVSVLGWSEAPLPWPLCRNGRCKGGRASLVLFEDLARAVRVESPTVVGLAWGISSTTVTIWRKQLEAKPFNAGSTARYNALLPLKFTPEAVERGRLLTKDVRSHARVQDKRKRDGTRADKWIWTPDQIALMGVLTDEEIGAQIGCHPVTVGIERRRRGIASIQYGAASSDLQSLDGALVRARRLELRLSQEVIGARVGVIRTRISHLENGRSEKVTEQTISALARALECQPDDLRPRDVNDNKDAKAAL